MVVVSIQINCIGRKRRTFIQTLMALSIEKTVFRHIVAPPPELQNNRIDAVRLYLRMMGEARLRHDAPHRLHTVLVRRLMQERPVHAARVPSVVRAIAEDRHLIMRDRFKTLFGAAENHSELMAVRHGGHGEFVVRPHPNGDMGTRRGGEAEGVTEREGRGEDRKAGQKGQIRQRRRAQGIEAERGERRRPVWEKARQPLQRLRPDVRLLVYLSSPILSAAMNALCGISTVPYERVSRREERRYVHNATRINSSRKFVSEAQPARRAS